ncbi:hypothetical protein NLI96_g3679 [Meripilus lineatus]|uniref:Uncharacterized protein n=1 Tax=Meripilus lineatus TaxID=2056292 RepID=A0AAD5V5Z5_9APHY|nr:hypothetical protein NLI96_g3679 [Physisporinus lineatus]
MPPKQAQPRGEKRSRDESPLPASKKAKPNASTTLRLDPPFSTLILFRSDLRRLLSIEPPSAVPPEGPPSPLTGLGSTSPAKRRHEDEDAPPTPRASKKVKLAAADATSEVTALEPASDGSQSQSPGEITTYEISISRPQSDTPNHGAKATPAGGDEDAVLEITQRSGNTTLKTLIPIKIRRDNLHFDNVLASVPYDARSYLDNDDIDKINGAIAFHTNIHRHPPVVYLGPKRGGRDDLSNTIVDENGNIMYFTFVGEATSIFMGKLSDGNYRSKATVNMETIRPQDAVLGWNLLNNIARGVEPHLLTSEIRMSAQVSRKVRNYLYHPSETFHSSRLQTGFKNLRDGRGVDVELHNESSLPLLTPEDFEENSFIMVRASVQRYSPAPAPSEGSSSRRFKSLASTLEPLIPSAARLSSTSRPSLFFLISIGSPRCFSSSASVLCYLVTVFM